jgi:NAD kinase
MKIGIATKLSKIDWDLHRLGISKKDLFNLYKKQEKDIDRIIESHERQKFSINQIISEFPDAQFIDMIKMTEDKNHSPKNYNLDLIMSIGGDNFFQLCAHYFPDSEIIGINSDFMTSYGGLLYFDYNSVINNSSEIKNKSYELENWTKISTYLNDNKIQDGICTVALSIKATDMISRYLLTKGNCSEEQKATGFLIVSGAGSGDGAWYRNAGLALPQYKSGLYPNVSSEFSKIKPCIKSLTREPFKGENCSYKMMNESVNENESLELLYWANNPSELSIDSIVRYDVFEGDRIKFKVSDNTLKVVKPF